MRGIVRRSRPRTAAGTYEHRLRLLGAVCIPALLFAASCRNPNRPPGTTRSTTPPPTRPGQGDVPPAGTEPIDRPTPSGCISNVGPSNRLTISGCGQSITYKVSVPSRCLQFACGLIVDVHGLAMNADTQEASSRIAAIGGDEGYIVVQPSSSSSSWSQANDSAVSAFMDLAIRVWKVETRRVHFTGYSMGGAMTLRMRCLKRDVIASAAPMSIGGSSGNAACPSPAPDIDTIYLQGNTDPLVQPASRTLVINDFRNKYGLGAGTVVQQDNDYVWTRYSNANGFVFETIMHDYSGLVGGHCFIGSPGTFGCNQNAPIQHGRVVVDFFKAHPKS